jgi:glycerophosphoryl diester phosphodiesterase
LIILSHRGYWKESAEKNTRISFERSFSMGFGTETDLRDSGSKIVISHDMADIDAMSAETFFDIYCSFRKPLPLALNIKADGLQQELKALLRQFEVDNYFVFDMAVPDGLIYARQQFTTYTRHSEYEPVPPYYDFAQGVWLDEFNGHWLTDAVIEGHLSQGKSLCIVSPDLHRRNNTQEWKNYKQLEARIGHDRIMLCTDFPEQAQEFFNDKD